MTGSCRSAAPSFTMVRVKGWACGIKSASSKLVLVSHELWCGSVSGGAGTTAAGLRWGLPTFICPFFADQFMWGFFVELAGVGPKACPINKLTAEILAQKLGELSSEDMQKAAQLLSVQMKMEDGIENGREHFIHSLPRENMLCDVSLLLGEHRIARYELIGTGLRRNGIKVGSEMAALLESEKIIKWIDWLHFWEWIPTWNKLNDRYWYTAGMRRHKIVSHNLTGHVKSFHHGLFSAIFGFLYGLISAAWRIHSVPDHWARRAGAFGCLFGIILAGFYLIMDFMLAFLVFFDRLFVGMANGWFGKDYDFIIDVSWKTEVHQTPFIEVEMENFIVQGIPRARRLELLRACHIVKEARIIFEEAKPTFPKEHMHFLVVRLSTLLTSVETTENKSKLGLNRKQMDEVRRNLNQRATFAPASFRRSKREEMIQSLREESKRYGENLNAATTTSDHGILNRLQAMKENMRQMLVSYTSEPEETMISFSDFVHALQPVCSRQCISGPLRSARPAFGRSIAKDDVYTEYLD